MSKEIIKDNNQTDERADKLKLFSIFSVVLLAAIILLVNFLFDKVLGKPLTFDFSDSFNNTISSETQEYLDSLPEGTNIKIVGLFNRPDNVASTEYQYIIPLLDDYVRSQAARSLWSMLILLSILRSSALLTLQIPMISVIRSDALLYLTTE